MHSGGKTLSDPDARFDAFVDLDDDRLPPTPAGWFETERPRGKEIMVPRHEERDDGAEPRAR